MRLFLVIFIWIFVWEIFIQENCGRQIEMILKSRGKCPNEEKNPARFDGNITGIGLNKYLFNGTFIVDRDITADLVVSKYITNFSKSINQHFFLKKKNKSVPGNIQTLQSNSNAMRRL